MLFRKNELTKHWCRKRENWENVGGVTTEITPELKGEHWNVPFSIPFQERARNFPRYFFTSTVAAFIRY